jgi:hypothetical protein
MRKVRILLAAAYMAVPLAAVTAQPAAACPDGACSKCRVNSPVTVGGGSVSPSGRPLVECYY